VLFALVTFSSFLTTLTSQVTALKNLNAKRDKEEQLLRNYFRGSALTLQLQKHIWQCFHEHYSKKQTSIKEEEIEFLQHTPENVMIMLHGELYKNQITKHPLLRICQGMEKDFMDMICHRAVTSTECGKQQTFFMRNAGSKAMYIVAKGLLSYSSPLYASTVYLDDGNHASEWALWVKWTHKGTMTAEENSTVLRMEGEAFRSVTELMGAALQKVFRSYAQKMVECYSQLYRPLTDVPYDDAEREEISSFAFDACMEFSRKSSQTTEASVVYVSSEH